MSRVLLPDPNSWLLDPLFGFFKLIKNEFNLTLYDALHEFIEHFALECQYLGFNNMSELSLYAQFNFLPETREAIIEKIFFISKPAKLIKTWNYLQDISSIKDKILLKKIKESIPSDFEDVMPGLQFFLTYNNLDIHSAKDLLYKYSYQRESIKKLMIIENEAKNFQDEALKMVIVTYDLSFLEKCKFFDVKRYEFFKQLLPPNLKVEIPISIDMDLKTVPDDLKNEQLFVTPKK